MHISNNKTLQPTMMFLKAVAVVFILVAGAQSSKILCIFPLPSHSHQSVFQPIWKALSLRGHQVTVITPNPLRDPSLTNLTEIDVSGVYKIQQENDANLAKRLTFEELLHVVLIASLPLFEYMLTHPDVQKIINKPSNSFDLVMIEYLHPMFFAFGGKFKCPTVGVTSLPDVPHYYVYGGAPYNPIAYPYVVEDLDDTGSFWKRLTLVKNFLIYMYYMDYKGMPRQEEIARKHFGEDIAPLRDIMSDVSAIFVTRNVFINKPRPLPPNIIEISRLNVKKDVQLPRDLKEYLDSATEGVVYFSLGSSLKTILIDDKTKSEILQALYRLPYKVLWKYENKTHPEMSKNVLTREWFPQQAVLNHKNVKVFVTQGGMQSLEESIHYRVPMVGMPFFGDQEFNVDRMVKVGIAKSIDCNTFTSEELEKTIIEVAGNIRYKERIDEVADALNDEPMNSLDKVVFWTEYVIKHKGAKFWRNDSLDLPLYKLLGLDIILIFVVSIVLAVYVLHALGHALLNHFMNKKDLKNKKD